MRTVNDHERAGIAAICIEDNVYPKRCSFYAGVRRELIPVEEHCGKIKAAKAAQTVPDFMVIARTEALIAGWGQEEALKRAEAYAEAGADAVLIHSKSKKPSTNSGLSTKSGPGACRWSSSRPSLTKRLPRKWKRRVRRSSFTPISRYGQHPRDARHT